MFGIFNINKPAYHTSRDVVNRVCRAMGTRRTGHAGTLDPMATGVLVVCVGPATRLANYVQEMPKSYLAEFQFGIESTTEDSFGEITRIKNAPEITNSQLLDLIPEFIGQIWQVPPTFSAVRIEGKRAYKLARRGETIQLTARPVMIHGLELKAFSYPGFCLKIDCGSGTYVRSLGRDIARRLGTGAIMTKLIRTAIGEFSLDTAVDLNDVESDGVGRLESPLLCVKRFPHVELDAQLIDTILHGGFVKHDTIAKQADISRQARTVVAIDRQQHLLAVLERFDQNNFKPKINFAHYWRDLSSPVQ